ncbi:hypothetical protein OH76DRAFT_1476595 [Lentinus brumalis]|uniref:Uncharacterized protein n=1 Tax=Lentinus brumalis TaxID=2498619 RepID=A0A371DX70_9APHY|nr:hypothetical protein OH76DRAFT_1476595 [Polyporus brumalis]
MYLPPPSSFNFNTRPTEKTLYPYIDFFGVATLLAEEMLLEAVPGIPTDAPELHEIQALSHKRIIVLLVERYGLVLPWLPWVHYCCFIVSTTPPPLVQSNRQLPIGVEVNYEGNSFTINPNPPLPIQGCHFTPNGDVRLRLQKPDEPVDYSNASFISSHEANHVIEYVACAPSQAAVCDPDVEKGAVEEGAVEEGAVEEGAVEEGAVEEDVDEEPTAGGQPWADYQAVTAAFLGGHGEPDERRYPLVKFSVDIPSTLDYATPAEFLEAVDKVLEIIERARRRYSEASFNTTTPPGVVREGTPGSDSAIVGISRGAATSTPPPTAAPRGSAQLH